MVINLACLQPIRRRYWSKPPHFPVEEVQPLKSIKHLPQICSELCCQGVNTCVCHPIEGWKEGPAKVLTVQAGDRAALLSVSWLPQGYRDRILCPLSASPHPYSLLHTQTHFHSITVTAMHFISCVCGSTCVFLLKITMLLCLSLHLLIY